MTPAEKLARDKPRRRKPRNHVAVKNKVWHCRARELRETLGLTLFDTATACQLSLPGYWQVEMGGDTSLTTAARIAAFFGRTIPELWTLAK